MLGLPVIKIIVDLYKVPSNSVFLFIKVHFGYLALCYLHLWLAINLTLSSPHTYYLNAIFFISFVYILYGISKIGAKETDTEYAFNYIKQTYSLDEYKIRELELRFITHLKEVENPEKVNLTELILILVDNEENLKLSKKYRISNNEIKLQEIFNETRTKYDENHPI
jgi:hypothetical protein